MRVLVDGEAEVRYGEGVVFGFEGLQPEVGLGGHFFFWMSAVLCVCVIFSVKRYCRVRKEQAMGCAYIFVYVCWVIGWFEVAGGMF